MRTVLPDRYVYRDGREVARKNPAGRKLMRQRTLNALSQQKGLCAICVLRLSDDEATPDHISPRRMGGGFRDDRPENIAAVHWLCNSLRGSQRKGFYGQ